MGKRVTVRDTISELLLPTGVVNGGHSTHLTDDQFTRLGDDEVVAWFSAVVDEADPSPAPAPTGGSSAVSRGVVEFTDPYTGSAGSWAPTLVITVAQDWIALKDGDATTLIVQPGTYLARYFISLSVNAVTGVALHPQSNSDVGPEVAALSDSGSAVEVVETYVFDAPTEMWPTLVGTATATNPQGDIQLLKLA